MYLDESGDPGMVNSPTRYFALSGLVIHELRWKSYLDELVTFRRDLKQRFGLKLREEIHAGAMLTRPGGLNRIAKHRRLEIIRRSADQLASMPELNVVNVLADKQGKHPNRQVDAAPSGMDENHDTTPPSLRSELELVTEEQLSRHLKICKRQLYNMRMRGESRSASWTESDSREEAGKVPPVLLSVRVRDGSQRTGKTFEIVGGERFRRNENDPAVLLAGDGEFAQDRGDGSEVEGDERPPLPCCGSKNLFVRAVWELAAFPVEDALDVELGSKRANDFDQLRREIFVEEELHCPSADVNSSPGRTARNAAKSSRASKVRPSSAISPRKASA